MFGDSLLPSECSLIVEELKQTSLCFQVRSSISMCVHLLETKTEPFMIKLKSEDFCCAVCPWTTNYGSSCQLGGPA